MNIKKILVSTAAGALMFGSLAVGAFADSLSVNFENPPYTLGVVNNQDGWNSLGAAGFGCATYDHMIDSSSATTGFGDQSLRISNAVTSGCFSDQTFSKSLLDGAGETTADGGTWSGGIRQNHFEAQFEIASKTPSVQQTGLIMSTSPDRGDGARMSYLRFEDQADGIHVFFDDYQDMVPYGTSIGDSNGCSGTDDFIETDIATLDRSVQHTAKFVIDFVDGQRNDKVKIYIDGVLKKNGTSWEDYFRYCEGNPTRPVDSLLFRTGGTAAPVNAGNGFLVDNLTLLSSTIKTLVGKATGGLTLSNPRQQISFEAFDYGASNLDEGNVEYQNFTYPGGLHYTAKLLCANVKPSTHEAWFTFQIPPGFDISGVYVTSYVKDLGTPGTKGDLYGHTAGSLASMLNVCENGLSVSTSSYPITGGNAVVHK